MLVQLRTRYVVTTASIHEGSTVWILSSCKLNLMTQTWPGIYYSHFVISLGTDSLLKLLWAYYCHTKEANKRNEKNETILAFLMNFIVLTMLH
jgi:hypothetical protein